MALAVHRRGLPGLAAGSAPERAVTNAGAWELQKAAPPRFSRPARGGPGPGPASARHTHTLLPPPPSLLP